MTTLHIEPGEPWTGAKKDLVGADVLVAAYFTGADAALIRADQVEDKMRARGERLSALFLLLSGFEAFLNCYFRILAEERSDKRQKLIEITEDKRKPLRKKALQLPYQAFGKRPANLEVVVQQIAEYAEMRHRYMHLKHEWIDVHIGAEITIGGMMEVAGLDFENRSGVRHLMVLIRIYMKSIFKLNGSQSISHLVDRWTKSVVDWR
ncbi:MAG: hypothetical protein ACE363_12670 [Alphaproteobacteria bacterium]